MQKHIGGLWVLGCFGWFAVADAQTAPPPAAVTQFDGTYAFVSATKVNETYTTGPTEHILPCGAYKGGPLTVVNGQARYLGRYYEGTVGAQGELAMRNVSTPVKWGGLPGAEKFISGRIAEDGAVRARQISRGCSYDLTLRKVQTPSLPIASAQFDGTYGFVSSRRVNQTYVNGVTGQISECPERDAGTLTVINGRAHLPIFEGTAGSHGELAMLRVSGVEGTVGGAINTDGTVKARRTISGCIYDTIWQKEPK